MNALPLFAQALGGYSIVQVIIMIIVVAAAIAILFVILRQMGVAIPPFIIQIFWILLAAVVGVLALVFLVRMVGSA